MLYGNNDGLIEETIQQTLRPILPKNIFSYEESEILKNTDSFKEILINKLDTHLTNTKNLIQDNFDIEIKYASKKGILKLLD